VHQSDRKYLQMFTIYIAKATANFGLPATRPIYERALEGSLFFLYRAEFTYDIIAVLPDRQTAEICLRFATLERKLGEIDRARAIYAHASQFCDPRVNPHFWSEWNSFEIETGSEDTFREMLRIKRSVQAQFNTEASYLAAQTITARQGTQKATQNNEPQDAMATAENQVYGGTNGPAFVSAKTTDNAPPAGKDNGMDVSSPQANNADEIQISDDEE
jgi:pre-mRNA-splicing factor SYF1